MSLQSRPLVVVTEGSAPGPLAWLAERVDVRQLAPDAAGFPEQLGQARGLVVRTYTRVDEALLAMAPQLRVVGRGGVGLENIDVAACRGRGVEVVYTPDANTSAVAELVMGLSLRLVRPWHNNEAGLFDAGQFKRFREQAGEELGELTLGILGMGRVGRAVSRIAERGFGMKVLYHDVQDVSAEVDTGAQAVDLEALLAESDVLSVHVDSKPGNRHLINRQVLERSRFRWLINTSRGMVVDPEALAPALEEGRLQGIALDVFDPEPPPATSAYARLLERWPGRVILTPHMASRTHRALANMSWVVRDVVAVLEGRPPRWPAP